MRLRELLRGLRSPPDRVRTLRIDASPNYARGRFQNLEPTRKLLPGSLVRTLSRQLLGREQRVPKGRLPIMPISSSAFDRDPATGLRVTWLGHSSVLVEIDERRLLLDPVWADRVSPLRFAGPKRFHPPPLPLDELPPLDAIIISHDHYDHLDRSVIRVLGSSSVPFITSLGVGGRLETWDVPPHRVTELDWGQSTLVGDLTVTATPARHFSGRGVLDGDCTLWSSWVITGPRHRVFFTGDTGYFNDIARIGETYGPFDTTLIKIGAYDPTWPDIHLTPEDAVRMHVALRGKVLVPVHWGTFNLAFHAWNEPPERLLAAAQKENVVVMIPRPGQQVEPGASNHLEPWWRAVN
jgi:L-ascorbate metabolism protein UlaG (beta-lactamase superfamily)